MKSIYQFRLLDELKASDTQVRISQLIGRKNKDGSLKNVEFQNETVVLQNGDGSAFEMAFGSASNGELILSRRGLSEDNPPIEVEHNKKTWGNGTKCYVTAGAGDFIDKDEPGIWTGKQTFEGGIEVKGGVGFDGQIDAKKGVKYPTFQTKEEATNFFSESEKVEGLLVNIKGNTYRWNSITKTWEMLGLADINQEKVQENSTKISTLEQKVGKLEEAGTPSYLGITGIVGEKYTMEDTLFLQKTPSFANSTIAINVGDTAANKEQHIQRIGSGKQSSQIKLKMRKVGEPTTTLFIVVKKGVRVDVSNNEAYWYGGAEITTKQIHYNEFTNSRKEFTINFPRHFGGVKGELLIIELYQQNKIINSSNYYQLACDREEYSEAFSCVCVNGNNRERKKFMPFCVSEAFANEVFVKTSSDTILGKGIGNDTILKESSSHIIRSSGSRAGASEFLNYIENKKFYNPTQITLEITGKCSYSGNKYYRFAPYITINGTGFTGEKFTNNDVVNTKSVSATIPAGSSVRIGIGINMTLKDESSSASRSMDILGYKLKVNGEYLTDLILRKKADPIGKPTSMGEIGTLIGIAIFGMLNGRFFLQEGVSSIKTGKIPLGNAVGFIDIGGYKIPYFG